jgi:hypothetical protein
MNKASLPEQLALLKTMTVTTGAIHEAQALQLKMWPRLIQKVTKSEARVDVEKRTVTYICESTGLRPTKSVKLTCTNICQWTRNLLWDETKVVIKINGKTVFNSDNQ